MWIFRRYILKCNMERRHILSIYLNSTNPAVTAICDAPVNAVRKTTLHRIHIPILLFCGRHPLFFTYCYTTLLIPHADVLKYTLQNHVRTASYIQLLLHISFLPEKILFSLKTVEISFKIRVKKNYIDDPLSPRRLIYLTWLSL